MNRINIYGRFLSLIVILTAFSSCEKEFSPKDEYQERFYFYCIVHADTNYQVATVFKNFDVEGIDPLENKIPPYLENAKIRLWHGNEVYLFKDSSETRLDTSRYKDDVQYYYIDNFKYVKEMDLRIEAVLENGIKLEASTTFPKTVERNGNRQELLDPRGEQEIVLGWHGHERFSVFFPVVQIYYTKKINNTIEYYKYECPVEIKNNNGFITKVFAKPGQISNITIQKEALDFALEDLYENDIQKKDYVIGSVVLELRAFGKNYSAYYSAANKVDDAFSVRLDEIKFSNITNAYGVFGSDNYQRIGWGFEPAYILDFGYGTEL